MALDRSVRPLPFESTGGSTAARRGLTPHQPPEPVEDHSSFRFLRKENMKSLITAIALALAAVTGSLHAAGKSCPTCCKDQDCKTCCKGKCDECANCNK